MSRVTPDDEYAAGIGSCASQGPLANCEKSTQAEAVVSIQRTSTTLSGGHSALDVSVWAMRESGTTASSANANRARDIRLVSRGKGRPMLSRQAWGVNSSHVGTHCDSCVVQGARC